MTLQEEEASTGLSEQEGTEGPRPPQILEDQLTLLQAVGGQIMPTKTLLLGSYYMYWFLSYILFVYTIRSQQLCFYIKN